MDVNKNQSGICVTMTTLNTIIEEQKKKARVETQNHCQKRYEGILQQEVIDGTVSYWGKRTDTLLTYAMPRAYKAGKTDWLRSEIEKLEGMKKTKTFPQQLIHFDHSVEYFERLSDADIHYNQALTSIITRYKEELKVLESK